MSPSNPGAALRGAAFQYPYKGFTMFKTLAFLAFAAFLAVQGAGALSVASSAIGNHNAAIVAASK